MAPLIDPVRIEGLRETVRALRQVSNEAPRALRLAANEAAEIVVREARRDMPSRSGRAKQSVRASSTRTAARVTEGGRRAPYVPWLDYGGKVGRGDTASRPFIPDGRYVYPAYRRTRPEFERTLRAGLAAVVRDAGLEMSG